MVQGSPRKGSVLFAHGAGAGMDTPFMDTFSDELASSGYQVIRFEFPYRQKMRQDGRRRPPDRMPTLVASLKEQWQRLDPSRPRVLMGKSMGGRVAMTAANALSAHACIALGYPLHPPGKPDNKRLEPLQSVRCPTLVIQGERDSMGKPDAWRSLTLARQIRLVWMRDGDHSLQPRKSSGLTSTGQWREAAGHVCNFLDEVLHVAG
jgi:hypothetical protein